MRYIFLFSFLLSATVVVGQERATISKLKEDRQKRKTAARKNINELKEGVLLVRLDFDKDKIAYFEKYNNEKEVRRLKEKAENVNSQIIDAFRTYFKFCEVYFFAMDDSRRLLEENFSEISFMDTSGALIPVPNLAERNYFIGEFTYIDQDTTTYYSSSTPSTNSINNPEGVTYYGGTKNNRSAFVIRDRKFVQLREPFPYFSAYKPFGPVKKRYRRPVMELEEKLQKYLGQRESINVH